MNGPFDPFIMTLRIESALLGLWIVLVALGFNLGRSTLATRPTLRERIVGRLPGPPQRLTGRRMTSAGGDVPHWRRFEVRTSQEASTVDKALDYFFLPAIVLGWVLALFIPAITFATLSLPHGLGARLWALPTFFLFLNSSILITTYAWKNFVWNSRATFPWRIYRVVVLQRERLRRAARNAERASDIRELTVTGGRSIETVLRSRYTGMALNASETFASRSWDTRIARLFHARASFLADEPPGTPPAVWFDGWIEDIATLLNNDDAAASTDAHQGEKLPANRKDPTGVLPMWILTSTAGGIGILTTHTYSHKIFHNWPAIAGVLTALAALATCITAAASLWRRNRRNE